MVLAAVACSGGIDQSNLEAQIAADLTASLTATHLGAVVSDVRCPPFDFADQQQQLERVCSARLGDQAIQVQVQVGSEDRVASAEIIDRLIDAGTVEVLVAERFAADLSLATGIGCGQPVVVVPVDGELRCTAVDSREVQRTVVITVDANRDLQLRLE